METIKNVNIDYDQLKLMLNKLKRPRNDFESNLKSDGIPKASAAKAVKSYKDFKRIQDYFMKKYKTTHNISALRNWCMWTIGVSFGVRISDLIHLRFCNLMNEDGTFKDRVSFIETKTDKINNCLITDSVKEAITLYKKELGLVDYYDYVLKSRKGKNTPITEIAAWNVLHKAGRELGFDYNIGSHSMRKTFATVAAISTNGKIDMNAISTVQSLLNHSSQTYTMKYIDAIDNLKNDARVAVSDFVLGKSKIKTLDFRQRHTTDDVYDLLKGLLLQEDNECE